MPIDNISHTVLEDAKTYLGLAKRSLFAVESELPEESAQRALLFRWRVSIDKVIFELKENSNSLGFFWGEFGKDPILPGKDQ